MRDFVRDFPQQLAEAIKIGESFRPKNTSTKLSNIIICGLGGSGIGGGIAKDLVRNECTVPITLVNDYTIPGFVNKNTLCIVSSYSGNTEETLEAASKAKRKGATICTITSGGKLEKLSKKNEYDSIIVPSGMPPRAALAYSLTQQLYIFHAYGFTSDKTLKQLQSSAKYLDKYQNIIRGRAKRIAKKIYNKIPVLYIQDGLESIAIRWRQQLNENSKMLLWHNKIPEMNHNELVGWAKPQPEIVPIFLSTDYDHKRSLLRRDLNKNVIKKMSSKPIMIQAMGRNRTEQAMYLINLGDWVSVDAADLREVDAMEVDVINELKSKLSKKIK